MDAKKQDYDEERFQEAINGIEHALIESALAGNPTPKTTIFLDVYCKNCGGFHRIDMELIGGFGDILHIPQAIEKIAEITVGEHVRDGRIPVAVFVVSGMTYISPDAQAFHRDDDGNVIRPPQEVYDRIRYQVDHGELTEPGTGDGFSMVSMHYQGGMALSGCKFDRSTSPPTMRKYYQAGPVIKNEQEWRELKGRIPGAFAPGAEDMARAMMRVAGGSQEDKPEESNVSLADTLFADIFARMDAQKKKTGGQPGGKSDDNKIGFSDN